MITAIASEPMMSALAPSDYRNRSASSERSLLPNSTAAAPKNSRSGADREFSPPEQQATAREVVPDRDSSSMFAAAVIAGALSPTPASLEELYLRIGTSTIPPESEARLKDLIA